MKIQLVTPARPSARSGNSITALRWKRILRELGHHVILRQSYQGEACDLMIALHARRSAASIRRFHERHPELPLIVALTGTDLYRDIRRDPKARRSLKLATRLLVLQSMGPVALPKHLRAKTRVIYQSAPRLKCAATAPKGGFKVCVVGHLRVEKDPLRTAVASRELPPSSRLEVVHVGQAPDGYWKKRAAAEAKRNPRYKWLGEMPHGRARRLLAG